MKTSENTLIVLIVWINPILANQKLIHFLIILTKSINIYTCLINYLVGWIADNSFVIEFSTGRSPNCAPPPHIAVLLWSQDFSCESEQIMSLNFILKSTNITVCPSLRRPQWPNWGCPPVVASMRLPKLCHIHIDASLRLPQCEYLNEASSK